MIAPDRLAQLDAELDAFGVSAERVAHVIATATAAKMSLEDVDVALGSLSERFETRVPDGSLARSGSWERAPSDPGVSRAPELAASDPGSGVLDVDPRSLVGVELPAVLSERPPSSEGLPIAVDDDDVEATGESDRSSIEISIEPSEPGLHDAPSIEASDAPAESALSASSLFDSDEGTDVHGRSELAAAESALIAAAGISALELDIDGEPTSGSHTSSAPVARRNSEQSSAKFSVPRDSVHPSPKSVIPAPPSSADLDADLASILADELAQPAAQPEQELESEATALFSADMFGALHEPSLAELISRPPPPDLDGDPADAVEIDIDDDVLVYEASAAPQPPPPPSGTRPPPGRSVPPPSPPGFLGRLLNRKP